MGMIPVVLAIAGFILLWMIVNYHSLSARRTHIRSLQTSREQLVNAYIHLTQQLSALLLIYGMHTPGYVVSLANEPDQKLNAAKLNKELEQIKLQAGNHIALQSNPDYQALIGKVELAARQLLKNQQVLLSEIKAYNQQATRMPYRIVAQLFGFRKIHPPVSNDY